MSRAQKTTIAILLVVLLLIVGFVAYVRFAPERTDEDVFTEPDTRDRSDTGDTSEPEPFVVIHSFENGVHHYGGSLEVPTPCHELRARAEIAESLPEQITIVIQTMPPRAEEACIQVLTQAPFDVMLEASVGARLTRVLFNGEEISFEVFEESKG